MKAKDTVFGSQAERRFYYELAKKWEGKLTLWHNLAFRCVFDFDDDDPFVRSLAPRLRNVLHTTSIDYVFCDPIDDRPVACVEFDGWTKGYSSGTKVVLQEPDPWRREKLTTKLQCAELCGLPFFVISYEHATNFSLTTQFAIIDGIIGDILAQKEARERARLRKDPIVAKDVWQQMYGQATDWRQWCFLTALVEEDYISQLALNPVFRLLYDVGYPFYPNISISEAANGLLQYECRLHYWDRQHHFGEAVSTLRFCMPRFQSAGYFSGILAVKIALLLAFEEAKWKGIVPKEVPPAICEVRVPSKQGTQGWAVIPNKAHQGQLPAVLQDDGFLAGGSGRRRSGDIDSLVMGLWWSDDDGGFFYSISDITPPK
jgi:hypothetical protein